jgi:hypothetical protein
MASDALICFFRNLDLASGRQASDARRRFAFILYGDPRFIFSNSESCVGVAKIDVTMLGVE